MREDESWFGKPSNMVQHQEPIKFDGLLATFMRTCAILNLMIPILDTTKAFLSKSFFQKVLRMNYNLCSHFRAGRTFCHSIPMLCHLISTHKTYNASTTASSHIQRIQSIVKRHL